MQLSWGYEKDTAVIKFPFTSLGFVSCGCGILWTWGGGIFRFFSLDHHE